MDLLPDFSHSQWAILMICAFFVGVSKTGIPGISIINVPLLAMIFVAKGSTGLLLPLLAAADLVAVAWYRRHAQWKHVFRLLPWALLGIGAGSVVIRYISDAQMKPIIGLIVLAMLALNFYREKNPDKMAHLPHHWAFAAFMGFFGGLTTQMANAAGPVMAIYLLSMNLPKNEYMGTCAWFFLILNYLKIPVFIMEGRISMESFMADLVVIPIVIAGAFIGIFILKKVPQKWFRRIVEILAVLAAVKLLIP